MDRWTLWTGGHYGQVGTMDRWALWTGGHYGQVVLYTGFIVLTVHVHKCMTLYILTYTLHKYSTQHTHMQYTNTLIVCTYVCTVPIFEGCLLMSLTPGSGSTGRVAAMR